jgi:hypothetical protein
VTALKFFGQEKHQTAATGTTPSFAKYLRTAPLGVKQGSTCPRTFKKEKGLALLRVLFLW